MGAALWWSLVTVSTVGYGDLAPLTAPGRLVAAVLIVLGVALFAAGVAIVGKHLAEPLVRHPNRERLARLRALERMRQDGQLDDAAFHELVRRVLDA